MRKLTLDLDALRVESFIPDEAMDGLGTVVGHHLIPATRAKCPPVTDAYTCDITCKVKHSCWNTCGETCTAEY